MEALMGTVMIRCPATGRDVSTGISADPTSFARSPVFFSRSYCPFCRARHEWFATDAWIDEPDGRAKAA
jgi:hypothetical protein